MTMTMTRDASLDDKDHRTVNMVNRLYSLARDHKRGYYDSWQRNYRLVNNKAAQLAKPGPRDSEVYPAIATLVAWMADQNTMIDVQAACDPHTAYADFLSQLANDLGTVLQTNWYVLDYREQVKMALWDAFMFGIGIFKTNWDNALDGGAGNVMLQRVDPWSFYWDPNATSMRDSEYFVEARRMSYDEIERRWPKSFNKLQHVKGDFSSDSDSRPNRLFSQGTTMHNLGNLSGTQSYPSRWATPSNNGGSRIEPRDGLIVYEVWIKENERYEPDEDTGPDLADRRVYECWRVVVVAGGQVLMDEKARDLWPHASHPYDRYVLDDIGEFVGITLVDHLASPQLSVNRLIQNLQNHAELVGNPILLEPSNSGNDRTPLQPKPGTRYRVNAAAMQNPPHWLQAPPMGYDVQNLIEFWIGRGENITGMGAAVKGAAPASRTPEGVLQTVQEAAFVRIRQGLANLEGTLRSSGYKMADLIVEYYDQPRYMAVVGPQSAERTMLALKARHFSVANVKGAPPFKYSLILNAGASSPTSRQARMAEADQAFALGAIDRQAWLEAHNYPNWKAINERIGALEAMGAFNPPGARQRAQRQT